MGDYIVLIQLLQDIHQYLSSLSTDDEKIESLNHIRRFLHSVSPFSQEPVDCVLWVKAKNIVANDYNPNVMAPAEKRLLEYSLLMDGFTQPVVVSELKENYTVVDGFHRYLSGKKRTGAGRRLKGYIPVTCINETRKGKAERIAATIRHNRARGRHHVISMSDIVRDLSRRGWSDTRIGTELGMEEDEVLRMKQISGLTEMFADEEFSAAWTVE